MSREPLLKLLSMHRPTDAQESADLARLTAAAAGLADPFSRNQWPEHFTASAVIVDPAGERVCLILHARLQRWLQPGGHCEPHDEGDLLKAAMREATEETGLTVQPYRGLRAPLDVDAHLIPAKKGEPDHHHLDVRFLLEALDPAQLNRDPTETAGAQWVTFEQAQHIAHEPAMRRMLAKAQARCAAAHGST